MGTLDLDKLHKNRFELLRDNLPPERSDALAKIFVGERILQTIDAPKLVLDGFRLPVHLLEVSSQRGGVGSISIAAAERPRHTCIIE